MCFGSPSNTCLATGFGNTRAEDGQETPCPAAQVDLALEARHLWQFNYNFRHSRNVRFPYPIYPLVAPEVLVETYEAGEGISSYVADPGRSTFKSR